MAKYQPSEPMPSGNGNPRAIDYGRLQGDEFNSVIDQMGSPYLNPLDKVPVAEALRERFKGDPALQAPGMPPNYGQWVLPHVMTLQGLVTTISRVYRISDEALNDSFDNARFMEYDLGIQECLEARIRDSVLLDWHIQPEDEKDVNQVYICGELTKIVRSIERWQQVLEQLHQAVWYGRSAVSFKYGWSQVGGQWYIKPVGDPSWLPVHGDKLVFRLLDDKLDHPQSQVGIRVGQTYNIGDRIAKGPGRAGEFWQVEPTDRGLAYFLNEYERKQLIIHKHRIQDAAFERPIDAGRVHGTGIRSQVYWEWFMKQKTLQWLMEFIERSAFGLELWYYPLGNEKARLDAEKAVKNRVGPFKNVLFVPKPPEDATGGGMQYGVEHIETGAAGADILLNIVDKYFGWRIKRVMLGQILTSEAEATGLGSRLADIHFLTYRSIIRYDCKNRDDSITPWINWLKNWNFPGNASWNARYVTETDPVEADSKLAALQTAQNLGAPIGVSQIYKAAGISPPEPDDMIAMPGGMAAVAAANGPVPGQTQTPDDSQETEEVEEPQQFSLARYSTEDHIVQPTAFQHPDTPEFHKWFNGSKVVDSYGKPAIMYHGTHRKFDTFSLEKAGERDSGDLGKGIYFTPSKSNAEMYAAWKIGGGPSPVRSRRVLPVYLSIKNPFDLHKDLDRDTASRIVRDASNNRVNLGKEPLSNHNHHISKLLSDYNSAQEMAALTKTKVRSRILGNYIGNSGLQRLGYDGILGKNEVVAFHPHQVKHAVENKGTFDPENDNIKYGDQDLRDRIAAAAKETDTNPSKQQKEAGNYKKGTVTIHGLKVCIENPKGTYRHYGEEAAGKKVLMKSHYGYIKGTEDNDGGQVDCFIGPDPESDLIYIVDQYLGGKFDEHKVLIGWYCEKEAREGYLENYEPGWQGLGRITPITISQFKEWLAAGNQKKSMAHQTAFYAEESSEQGEHHTSEFTHEIGTHPIPEGHIRLFHYTRGKPESLRQHGIKMSHARGTTYGEPNYIWGSTNQPEHGHNIVEFHIPAHDKSIRIGKLHDNQTIEDFHKGTNHVAVDRDIKPHEIIAVHEPWHHSYHYIKKNPDLHAAVLAGEHDELAEKNDKGEYRYEREGPSVDRIKSENKSQYSEEVTQYATSTEQQRPRRFVAPETTAERFQNRGGIRAGAAELEPSGSTALGTRPLAGLPQKVNVPGHGEITAGPHPVARAIAHEYMKSAGLEYHPPTQFKKVDPERAKRIADEYEKMPHSPHDPQTKASYEAMIRETLAQYQHIKRSGLKVSVIKPGQPDPYAASPRLATEDIKKNNHFWLFPTSAGFGSDQKVDVSNNPLLGDSGEKSSDGHPLTHNDIFRVVHDYFGHAKEGNGFRADGEENAWRSHAAMYSPLARRAMTTETRGQNSWVNFGPHGESNKKAKTEDTVFADQKTGLLPEWVSEEGRHDDPVQHYSQYSQETQPDIRDMIRSEEPAHASMGALVGFKFLRKRSGLSKTEFDKLAIRQHNAGEIIMHRHDSPLNLDSEALDNLVHDPSAPHYGHSGTSAKGTFYVGASLGREHR